MANTVSEQEFLRLYAIRDDGDRDFMLEESIRETSAAQARVRELEAELRVMAGAPEFPFRIEAPGIDCWVYLKTAEEISAALDGRGDEAYVGTGYSYENYIAMREYDERVLLHEVLHVLVRTDPSRTLTSPEDEELVRHVTSGLFAMGWRWRVIDESVARRERDVQRAQQERLGR